MGSGLHTSVAAALRAARLEGLRIDPVTASNTNLTVDEAYAVQRAGVTLRANDGEVVVGAKLGLTSAAKQAEVGFDQPIYGWLTDAMHLLGSELPLAGLVVPRAEPEIALILTRDLDPAGEPASGLIDAIAAVAPAIEVLDSRYHSNAPSLPDVIADGASGAAFAIGAPVEWSDSEEALDAAECELLINGTTVGTARAAEALGGPLRALHALNLLVGSHGGILRAGDIVLTGGLTRAHPIRPGDTIEVRFPHPIGALTLVAAAHPLHTPNDPLSTRTTDGD